jgi:hypothetical protein
MHHISRVCESTELGSIVCEKEVLMRHSREKGNSHCPIRPIVAKLLVKDVQDKGTDELTEQQRSVTVADGA